MKKSGLEIGVLIVGALIIITSLLVKFIFNLPMNQTLVISNIIFSVGFLIYILYSIMTANALNKEIRGLNNHVAGLKKELEERNKEIQAFKADINALNKEKADLASKAANLESELTTVNEELAALRASQNTANE